MRLKASDVRAWQNALIKRDMQPTYKKSINNQLSALTFNYATQIFMT